jgi:hypothetical protein
MWCRSHRRVVQECLAAKDAEIAKLSGKFSEEGKQGALILELGADALDQALKERDAARAEARQLRLEQAESALCDFHEPDETDCEDCQEARTEARRALEKGAEP